MFVLQKTLAVVWAVTECGGKKCAAKVGNKGGVSILALQNMV